MARIKYTADGLKAVYNPKTQLWEYYRHTERGDVLTGSTQHYQHT